MTEIVLKDMWAKYQADLGYQDPYLTAPKDREDQKAWAQSLAERDKIWERFAIHAVESLSKKQIRQLSRRDSYMLWRDVEISAGDVKNSEPNSEERKAQAALKKLVKAYKISDELVEWVFNKLEKAVEKHGTDFRNVAPHEMEEAVHSLLEALAKEYDYNGKINLKTGYLGLSTLAQYEGVSYEPGTIISNFTFSKWALRRSDVGKTVLHEFAHMLLDPKAQTSFFHDIPNELVDELKTVMSNQRYFYFSSKKGGTLYRRQPSEAFANSTEILGREALTRQSIVKTVIDKLGLFGPSNNSIGKAPMARPPF